MVPIKSQCKDDREYLEALRLYFAGQALCGITHHFITNYDGKTLTYAEEAVESAYKYADFMLLERERNQNAPATT